MKMFTLLALAAGCSAGDNLGNTPVLGQQHWTIALGSDDLDQPAMGDSIAFASDGNVVVAGSYRKTVDFGTSTHTAQPGSTGDLFLTKRSVVDGSELWTNVVGASALGVGPDIWLSIDGIAVDGAGDIVIAGTYGLDEDFGGTTLPASAGSAFVAKYADDGHLVWVRAFGPNSALRPQVLALDGDAGITLSGWTGTTPSTVQLPFHQEMCTFDACPNWIVHLAADGTPSWDGFLPFSIGRIAARPDGSFTVASAIDKPMTIAGAQLLSQSRGTPIIVHLAADGTPDHATSYGEPQLTYSAVGLIEGPDGPIALTNVEDASFASTMPQLTGLDGTGDVAWSSQGLAGPVTASALALAPNGALLVSGRIGDYVADFGNGAINGTAFIASYAPSGEFLDARSYGASGSSTQDGITSIATSSDGTVAFVGTLGDSLDFGTGAVSTHGMVDVVIGVISPPLP